MSKTTGKLSQPSDQPTPGAGAARRSLPPSILDQQMGIVDKSDQEIFALAEPLWRDMVKSSNEGKYGEFTRNFARDFARAMNQVEVGHQFAQSELARNLSDDFDMLGTIRRGEHVTVLIRQRSTARPGEWLGRLVLGEEDGQTRVFGASIF